MATDGYSNLDYLLGIKILIEKQMIEQVWEEDINGRIPSYRVTPQAWSWIESKRENLPTRISKRQPPALSPIVSEESPAPIDSDRADAPSD